MLAADAVLSLDRCRAALNDGAGDDGGRPYSDDEVRAVREFLYALARAVRPDRTVTNETPAPPLRPGPPRSGSRDP